MKARLILILVLSLNALVTQAAEGDAKPAAPASREEVLKKYDKNADGKLDQQERAARLKDREAELLKRYDKNSDGKLDEKEQQLVREAEQKERKAIRQEREEREAKRKRKAEVKEQEKKQKKEEKRDKK